MEPLPLALSVKAWNAPACDDGGPLHGVQGTLTLVTVS